MPVNIFGSDPISVASNDSGFNPKLIDLNKYVLRKVNKSGDEMTGDLNMNDHRIMNIPYPTDNNDVVSKGYVNQTLRNEKEHLSRLIDLQRENLKALSLKVDTELTPLRESVETRIKNHLKDLKF